MVGNNFSICLSWTRLNNRPNLKKLCINFYQIQIEIELTDWLMFNSEVILNTLEFQVFKNENFMKN